MLSQHQHSQTRELPGVGQRKRCRKRSGKEETPTEPVPVSPGVRGESPVPGLAPGAEGIEHPGGTASAGSRSPRGCPRPAAARPRSAGRSAAAAPPGAAAAGGAGVRARPRLPAVLGSAAARPAGPPRSPGHGSPRAGGRGWRRRRRRGPLTGAGAARQPRGRGE